MQREQRLVFGEDAELYDRARPQYPVALVDEVLGLGPVSWMADAGCGTGKAATPFARRGIPGVGIEPDPAMAAVAERNLRGHSWRVDVAPFEQWTPRGDDPALDLLVSGQAWHWFTPVVRYRRAAEVLRPGGWLALWWNRPATVENSTRRSLDAIYDRLAPRIGHRGYPRRSTLELTDHNDAGAIFGRALERVYPWERSYTATEWTDLLRTQSDHRMLAPELLSRLLEAIGEAIEIRGGSFSHPYVCVLWAGQRRTLTP